MKKMIFVLSGLVLTSALAFAQTAAPATTAKPKPTPQPKAAKTAAPKSDADIQACIADRLSKAPKLKTQGFSATVSGGVATFTGTATNPGSKGGVSGIAKTCGAKQIVNNITIQAATKPAATPKPTKKP